MPAAYVDQSVYDVELVKRVAGLSDKDVNELPDRDFKILLASVDISYLPDNKRSEAQKAFLELLAADKPLN